MKGFNKSSRSRKISGQSGRGPETAKVTTGPAGMRKAGMHPNMAVGDKGRKMKGGKYC